MLFRVRASLLAEISLVGITSFAFEILVGKSLASVAAVVVVVGALLLLLLEVVALGVGTPVAFEVAAIFLVKISSETIVVVVTTLVATVEVASSVVVVASFLEASLVVRVATV